MTAALPTIRWNDMAPLFLRELGLDASASDRDIKRAYAERLKTIDPATQPAAFAQLREAFEAARAWAAANTSDVAEPPMAPFEAGVAAPPADTDAESAMDALREALATRADVPASQLLAETMAYLGTRQLDARHAFETLLIDAIASQGIIRRAGLFPSASETFAWQQTGGSARGPQADAWLERATASLATWQGFPEKRRRVLLPLLKQAARENAQLSPETLHGWPRIAAVMPYVGEYVRLHVDDDVLAHWKAAFNALPAAERGQYRDAAWDPREPDTPLWRRALSALSRHWWWLLLITKAVLIALKAGR
jgi:hypothetical protein